MMRMSALFFGYTQSVLIESIRHAINRLRSGHHRSVGSEVPRTIVGCHPSGAHNTVVAEIIYFPVNRLKSCIHKGKKVITPAVLLQPAAVQSSERVHIVGPAAVGNPTVLAEAGRIDIVDGILRFLLFLINYGDEVISYYAAVTVLAVLVPFRICFPCITANAPDISFGKNIPCWNLLLMTPRIPYLQTNGQERSLTPC